MSDAPPEPWRARLVAAEIGRAEQAKYWSEELPRFYRDDLVPAVREFQEALAQHVSAAMIEQPATFAVTLRFDDWHLDEWVLTVRLVPTVIDRTLLEIHCAGLRVRKIAIARSEPWDRARFLDALADAYIEHTMPPLEAAAPLAPELRD